MFYKRQKKKDRSDQFLLQRELAVLVAGATGFFTLFALISYNRFDATFFYYATNQDGITNWCGALGANVAAALVYLFGAGAYLIVPLLVLPIAASFTRMSGKQLAYRMVAGCFVVMQAVTIMSFHGVDWMSSMPGGMIGWIARQRVVMLLGDLGAALWLWVSVWIALVIGLKIPLLPLVVKAAAQLRQLLKKSAARIPSITPARLFSARKEVVVTPQESLIADEGPAHVNVSYTEDFQSVAPVETVLVDRQAFELHELRREADSHIVLRWRLFRLRNTVLARNMFSGSPSLYDKLMAVPTVAQFMLPEADLFNQPSGKTHEEQHRADAQAKADKVVEKLERFGLKGSIVDIKPGPVVTMYEYKPEIDSKISKIMALEDDLAMALTATSLRIIAPIPGKSAVGFEIANRERDEVLFSQLLTCDQFVNSKARLPMILGVDASGAPVIEDMASMPHLLVGGSTGSGKSVGLNVMLVSLLCKRTPDELKLILIDPKRLEFTPYAHIPHLLFPIVTQPQKASGVLQWVVHEMEERYTAMAAEGVRNVQEYRKLSPKKADGSMRRDMPYLVVIIDELADLMMVAGKDVEMHIVRIAQMARAAGIHMIVATQRPSVDVVTGLIKVNFPSRVAFRVSSKIDSRTILDAPGAEKLLGRGDGLFIHGSSPDMKRIHCPYVSDQEVESVAEFLRKQRAVNYIPLQDAISQAQVSSQPEYEDDLYQQIREYVRTQDEISISLLQRQYRIGFNRSARLIEKLELDGVVAPAQGSKPRRVIKPTQESQPRA